MSEKTLRDELAMAALQGILSNENLIARLANNSKKEERGPDEILALASYAMADAMLKQREVKND